MKSSRHARNVSGSTYSNTGNAIKFCLLKGFSSWYFKIAFKILAPKIAFGNQNSEQTIIKLSRH